MVAASRAVPSMHIHKLKAESSSNLQNTCLFQTHPLATATCRWCGAGRSEFVGNVSRGLLSFLTAVSSLS